MIDTLDIYHRPNGAVIHASSAGPTFVCPAKT
jgi:hypothetical protein